MKSGCKSTTKILTRAAFAACILSCAVLFLPGKPVGAAQKTWSVNDAAELLTTKQEDELDLLLLNLEKKTGVQVVVLTNADNKCPEMDKIDPGQRGKAVIFRPENRIQLLFCNHGGRDCVVKSALGRKVELVLNSGEVELAASANMKPYCEKKQYDRCIMGGVFGVVRRVAAEYNMTMKDIMLTDAPAKYVPPPVVPVKDRHPWIIAALAGFLLGGILGALARKFAPRRIRAFLARRGGKDDKWSRGFGGGFGGW